jgi:lipopolysaccharide/colanic/teichoic acid biosynthesis glycosyltransferase
VEVLRLAVVPDFVGDEAYAQAIHAIASGVQIVAADRFGDFLESHELADRLLFIDARYPPIRGWSFGSWLSEASNERQVRHLVVAGHAAGGLQESVRYDDDLRARAVHRLYDGVTHLGLAHVMCSLVPVAAAQSQAPFDLTSLSLVRARLAQSGVPSVDDQEPTGTLDLTRQEDLLRANEQALCAAAGRRTPDSLRQYAPDIWVGQGVTIHSTSRIYSPVVIHDRATIGPGAAVIGPAVLGTATLVGQDATVAQSVVWPQARVAPGGAVVHAVFVSGRNGDGGGGNGQDFGRRRPARHDAAPPAGHNGNGHTRVGRLYPVVKRSVDLLVTVPGLVVISPLLALVAVLIKLTSRGPVLFGHEREGLGGRPFRCWKFRTMVHRAHHQQRELYAQNLVDGPQFKLANDRRITYLGHWLRRTNIDELPQLLNVLLGHMSLIGPRPSPFRENQICVPWREARLSVRPGITGLWQVCRRDRDAGDFHQWIYYDVLYVRHRSLWLDLRIFLATLITLAGRWPVKLHWMIPAYRMAAHESLFGTAPPAADAREARCDWPDPAWQHHSTSADDHGRDQHCDDGKSGNVSVAAAARGPRAPQEGES